MAPNPSPNIKAAPVLTAIDGILDLHAFRPKEVPDLIREYLRSCRAAHVTEIRIIHGKGKGILRETVHTLLRREPMVRNFRLANDRSGWGATLVDIYPPGVPLPPRSAPASKAQMLESAPGWYRLLQRIFVKR
ncbi:MULTISPECIES: Smr/MutS family protein [Acidithiobacillus]|jgi:Mismatch repair ATPase (MutS family)|uniref:DNA mismatch repair protein MutS n=3 Tax=Acidithiobacillus TaxID=119977 RepID=A0A179BP84_ACIFR|nr:MULTISPECIES: Smr/MutS family protein [Acidithiobacillus]OYV81609.1 MAG: DNA mismatch repair protein MutS [Acidithiobacillus ferrivorans]MBU2785945.1 Smr/MutS family protein [Acidithiobacillus ferriphilus]MBU2826876.1 Smr/MutS family protein [Acidithiobacillus ferriphilus]MBU2830025.1 Smr/MutS family protein [Acidithiobacillus ferriphilus]MBU2844511.1 Smr/MutS family protein [Acidithiobacillus ferriphilus]